MLKKPDHVTLHAKTIIEKHKIWLKSLLKKWTKRTWKNQIS